MELRREGEGFVLEGSLLLEEGHRGFEAKLFGCAEVREGTLKKFDVVARGRAWGRHSSVPYAPLGKYTLAIAFSVAKPGESLETLPVHNWMDDYLQTENLRISEVRGK